MYTYKCYFHPKDDSAATCKGCKLPLCGSCQGFEGFCPECVEKRKAVHQLKQLRNVVASRTHMAASTTGRLKLAIQQAGPPAARRPAGPGPLPPIPSGAATGALSPTRPLDPALARSMTRQLPAEPVPQPRRYNPEAVAYKPHSSRAPETRHQPVKRAAKPTPPKAAPASPGWAMPFAAGLGVGIVLVVVLLLGQSVLHRAKPRPKPAHQQTFTQQEVATAKALLGQDAAPLVSMSEGKRADDTPQVGWSGR